jgi:hypothetical protein
MVDAPVRRGDRVKLMAPPGGFGEVLRVSRAKGVVHVRRRPADQSAPDLRVWVKLNAIEEVARPCIGVVWQRTGIEVQP